MYLPCVIFHKPLGRMAHQYVLITHKPKIKGTGGRTPFINVQCLAVSDHVSRKPIWTPDTQCQNWTIR